MHPKTRDGALLERVPPSRYGANMNGEARGNANSDPAVSPEVVEMAMRAVRDFHSCFWWWNPGFVPRTREDVREIVLNLRKGDRRAWQRAQELNACL